MESIFTLYLIVLVGNPKDGMEKEREVIKTLIKEGLGMLNKARSQALFLDDNMK